MFYVGDIIDDWKGMCPWFISYNNKVKNDVVLTKWQDLASHNKRIKGYDKGVVKCIVAFPMIFCSRGMNLLTLLANHFTVKKIISHEVIRTYSFVVWLHGNTSWREANKLCWWYHASCMPEEAWPQHKRYNNSNDEVCILNCDSDPKKVYYFKEEQSTTTCVGIIMNGTIATNIF